MKRAQAAAIQPDQRSVALSGRRNLKMAQSAHAYVRGSTVRFYEWLEEAGRTSHVGNLGPIGGADGTLEVQVRDLDQTVIGNPAHDLVRLALSLAMAARGSALSGVTTAHMLESMVAGYESSIEVADPETSDLDRPPGTVKRLLRDAARRSWKHLADERIEGLDPVIPLGQRFWPLRTEEREAIEDLIGSEEVQGLVASLRFRDNEAKVAVADSAFWRKGCSSLGNLRFAVLAAIRSAEEKHPRYCLLDIKEAMTPAAPRYTAAAMPRDNAMRVVEGARHLSPILGRRMLATRLLGKGVFVRELLPQDLKLELDSLDQEEASDMARYLAMVVGRAHGRQMSAAERRSWLGQLHRNRSRTLDAPSWLWKAVVELVASHETAYLEHCRRYALQPSIDRDELVRAGG
jgi:uncharacterized protein (DUF2252 family)